MCCDGTWNTPNQPSVTNVFRLRNALGAKDADGHDQLSRYQSGVGTEGGPLAWLLGGIAGVGLSSNVMDAYRWLTTTYEPGDPGDRIALFGFSRGAYTARSLAGMIAACGILATRGQDDATIRRQIEHVYDHKYRAADRADPFWRDGLKFSYDPADEEQIPVHFIGVWDTVGSLGIPDNLGFLNLWDFRRRYAFHNMDLNPHIRVARHAVAMDERRGPFSPSLWDESTRGTNQDIQQVWFPGSHLDVGGGHPETGLSDGALQWMITEAEKARMVFDDEMTKQVSPNAGDVLHDDDRSSLRLLGPVYDPVIGPLMQPFFETRPRAVPRINPDEPNNKVDKSVYDRHKAKILTSRTYRPTRVPAIGSPITVTVLASEPWNETGLYLEPGKYRFTAKGEWFDANIRSDPAGTTGIRPFNPVVERFRLLSTLLLSPAETLFRWAFRNEAANFLGSRREEDLPWMSLVGVVANEDGKKPLDEAGPRPHQRIDIGTVTNDTVTVTEGGYFYAYANDAWGFYGNNRGAVRLTVTRT